MNKTTLRAFSLGLVALLAAPLVTAGCEAGSSGGAAGTGSGGGTTAPENTNKVDASTTGAAELQVKGTQPTPDPNSFGANIGDARLTLLLLGDDGTAITAILDTTNSPLPGEVPVGTPNEVSWVTVAVPTAGHVYNTFEGSGAVVINQCPGGPGDAFTGSFNGIRLKDEVQQGEITLNGTFNLMVATAAGPGLNCKPTTSGPDASTGTDTTTGGDTGPVDLCPMETCDGPCCPFAQCIGQCQLDCVMQTCLSNPAGCEQCMTGCYPQCNVSAACQTAADAVQACSVANGCDSVDDEDDTCLKTHCCTELQAAM